MSDEIKVVMFVGDNAPNRDAELKVVAQPIGYDAYYEPGYDVCGDPDCECRTRILVGHGKTPEEAKADYWQQWEDRCAG